MWQRRGVDQQRRDGFLMEKVSRFLSNLQICRHSFDMIKKQISASRKEMMLAAAVRGWFEPVKPHNYISHYMLSSGSKERIREGQECTGLTDGKKEGTL